ncbi:Uncharacterised protein [Klebsiella pneumoniae]|uniref:hypothetical protein n=1 Tax=Klebsiella pneumoniae TaxID=573 RepID=UPI000E2D13E0|nr:hypothetical protein [Klebsiella pneumoniae]SWX75905.1 Uncharacterised protein [Klebsiella pneumoniae]
MKFSKFTELVARIWSNQTTQRRDPEITIAVHSPGNIGPSPSVEVEAIHAGFDWDAGQVMIYPAQPLTVLTPEQVAEISESVRKGQSWHAYEAYKKHKAQLENAALEYAKVAGQRDELLAALERLLPWAECMEYAPPGMEFSGDHPIAVARAAIARVKGGAA